MQTEKKGLTKREKIMVLLLIIIGSLALMVAFVILPLYNQLNDKNDEYGALELEKSQIEVKLATETVARVNHTSLLMKLNRSSERFLNPSLSNEIGRMLTGLCETYGLQPVSQQLSAPKDFTTVEIKPGAEKTESDSVFLIVSAAMTVKGSYEDLKNLLDAVERIEYFRISRVSFSANAAVPEAGFDRISLFFEVTMLKDVLETIDS